MDKLSNRVIVFAARRKTPNGLRAAGMTPALRFAGALVCRWQRDPATCRLHCTWSQQIEVRDFDANPRLRLAG